MDAKQLPTTLAPPSKKHKSSHHHSDGKTSSKKHSKSKKSSHHEASKPVSVKKESVSPAKKKPMISESDSEDEIPLAVQKSMVKEEPHLTNSAPTADHPLINNIKVKPEKKINSIIKKEIPLVPSIKNEKEASSVRGAVKRKRTTSQSEGSEYEEEQSEEDEDDDFKPSSAKKPKKTPAAAKTKKPAASSRHASSSSSKDKKDKKKKTKPSANIPSKKSIPSAKTTAATPPATVASPVKGGRKKKEEEKEVRKWWEEEPLPDGIKWMTLEHKGPYFAPPYERLPAHVKFLYDGKPMELSEKAEEAAGFFAKMLDHDYTSKEIFCKNFFQDWRKEMTSEEAGKIKDFNKCDFHQIHEYYKERAVARKAMTKEEKLALKKENEDIIEEYGWCIIDGHKERIGNFKIEPPSLFRGRGDHPKQGRIKKRIEAKDIQINIGKDAKIPQPPEGQSWKSVHSDNKVTWLACWTENIQGAIKYVMLSPTSKLKGEKDWAKYETARRLKGHVDKIRAQYKEDLKAKEMWIRQRAVAVYFIDKLALRAGNEKDSDESADTVGCCSLRVEHITLHEELDGKENVIEFDFLGKDSIRYFNRVPVDRQVFKNVRHFMKDKNGGDDLFDRLTTTVLNKHLSELMEGLTAKVFRTYNASKTLQDQLNELTVESDILPSKILSYNRANRAVAILCNHQRAPPKTFDQQMTNLQGKIQAKEDTITETKAEIKALKKEAKSTKDSKTTKKLESKKKQLARLEEQLQKLEVQATDKQENKEIALGTSKLNYLDPRISVGWCKKWNVPVEKVYNKTQRQKFAWAIDMAEADFEF